MRTYVSPLGYHSTRVTRPVLSNGLDPGDGLVLLRPATETDETRAKEAITDVERMLEQIEPDVAISMETVPHDDLAAATVQCSDVLRAAEGDVVVNFGGGARDVFLPFTVAVLANVGLVDEVLAFSDIDGTVREWTLPNLATEVSGNIRETLRHVASTDGSISVPALAERSEFVKSTVSRHVSRLAEMGAVRTWPEGKTKVVEVTLTGQLALGSSVDR